MGYEEKLRRGEGSKIARRCWEEIKKRAKEGKELSHWKVEKAEFLKIRDIRMR